ncbi:MAG: ECF-type sigma factor [Rhodanobacteraceae bacterium]
MPASPLPAADKSAASPPEIGFDAVYQRLKALAGRQLAREAGGTLDTTALVHEVFLRVDGGRNLSFEHSAQFFAYAARASADCGCPTVALHIACPTCASARAGAGLLPMATQEPLRQVTLIAATWLASMVAFAHAARVDTPLRPAASHNATAPPLGALLEQKIHSSDGAADDNFSYAVAISGSTAVVGAPNAAVDANSGQGSVYVFTESGGTWSQGQRLIADDGAADDAFGFSVSLSGTTILIGAPYATIDGRGGQGAAYVFDGSGGSWTQVQKLTSDDGDSNNNFGWSVAVSGSNALISSPVAPVGQNALQGKAYIFTETSDVWTQGPTLTADDGAAFDSFGYSVALDGTTAVVGAQGVNSYFGAAYVFDGSGGTWIQTGELVPDDGTTLEFFGISVAVSGANALVGAYYQNVDGHAHQGSAYVFTNAGGSWAQARKLTASESAAGDRFGLAVALDGSTALVGAYFAGNQQGAAYEFTEDAGNWTETRMLVASDGATGDHFGNAVALAGDTAIIGAFDAGIDGHASQGAAYVYTPPGDDTIFANGFDAAP